jgi:hypothetical protein
MSFQAFRMIARLSGERIVEMGKTTNKKRLR